MRLKKCSVCRKFSWVTCFKPQSHVLYAATYQRWAIIRARRVQQFSEGSSILWWCFGLNQSDVQHKNIIWARIISKSLLGLMCYITKALARHKRARLPSVGQEGFGELLNSVDPGCPESLAQLQSAFCGQNVRTFCLVHTLFKGESGIWRLW